MKMKTGSLLVLLTFLKCAQAIEKGDPCTIPNARGATSGVCKEVRLCPVVLDNWRKRNIKPTLCDPVTRIICCPNPTTLKPRGSPTRDRISSHKCKEYSQLIYGDTSNGQCGHNAIQFIVGGTESTEREFPHMALIGYRESIDDDDYACGGSLISEKFVLSAAHCTFSRELKEAKYVKLGDVRRYDNNRNTYKYVIIERKKHPQYNSKSIDFDIALFKLDRDVEFNAYVLPICLPQIDEEPDKAYATGWGRESFGSGKSENLLKVTLDLFTQRDCQAKYPNEGKVKNGIDYQTKVCAGSKTYRKDTCDGDSGGPLQIYNQDKVFCMYTIIGITSFGTSYCGSIGTPGIYTRVFHYVDWIEEIIWDQ